MSNKGSVKVLSGEKKGGWVKCFVQGKARASLDGQRSSPPKTFTV